MRVPRLGVGSEYRRVVRFIQNLVIESRWRPLRRRENQRIHGTTTTATAPESAAAAAAIERRERRTPIRTSPPSISIVARVSAEKAITKPTVPTSIATHLWAATPAATTSISLTNSPKGG